MATQPINKLNPDPHVIVKNIDVQETKDPNPPDISTEDDIQRRLRELTDEWRDTPIRLLAWSEDKKCWYMWRCQ